MSGVASLPTSGAALAGLGIKPVTKEVFIDLLDPLYVVDAGKTIKDVIAEKIEGLAWGPDLADGRHVLYVTSDNDLFTGDATHPGGNPTQIYAFAIGAAANLNLVPQQVSGPMFAPGQVKKALK